MDENFNHKKENGFTYMYLQSAFQGVLVYVDVKIYSSVHTWVEADVNQIISLFRLWNLAQRCWLSVMLRRIYGVLIRMEPSTSTGIWLPTPSIPNCQIITIESYVFQVRVSYSVCLSVTISINNVTGQSEIFLQPI